jgi:hypothetical protein
LGDKEGSVGGGKAEPVRVEVDLGGKFIETP